ncbi:MAG: coproporphyrinogen III oxidase [Bradymonadia bacterium]|jgi:coproporphyrinogen III oxidase
MTDLFDRAGAVFRETQESLIGAFESLEAERGGSTFFRDDWKRPTLPADSPGPILGGGGLTCVLEDGVVFDRAGVNFSAVHGKFSEEFAKTMPGDGTEFHACGVSLVVHPKNPHVPTVHMNHRRLSRGSSGWFGGGADLTPYYLDEDDARHFHATMKAACDEHPSVANHAAFKKRCDEYFYNSHRGEARGIGGTFFDHLSEEPEKTLEFIRTSCAGFIQAYLPIVEKHIDKPYSEAEKNWQELRRGRYVEFNLIHDRGTTFGLKTGGRTESILMSMPPRVTWRYDHQPEPGSREARIVEVLKNPVDWV